MKQFVAFMDAFGLPLLVFVAVVLVVVFVVWPIMKLLSVSENGRAQQHKEERPLSKKEVDALVEELEASLFSRKPTLTDQEKINRLAKSDPEKAKELVCRWLRE